MIDLGFLSPIQRLLNHIWLIKDSTHVLLKQITVNYLSNVFRNFMPMRIMLSIYEKPRSGMIRS